MNLSKISFGSFTVQQLKSAIQSTGKSSVQGVIIRREEDSKQADLTKPMPGISFHQMKEGDIIVTEVTSKGDKVELNTLLRDGGETSMKLKKSNETMPVKDGEIKGFNIIGTLGAGIYKIV